MPKPADEYAQDDHHHDDVLIAGPGTTARAGESWVFGDLRLSAFHFRPRVG